MNETRRAQLAVVVAAMLVGTTGTAQALGPDTTTPLGVGAVRALLGAASLWLFVRRPSVETLRSHRGLIVLGALGVAVYQPAFFVGVDRIGVAYGTVLSIGSGPMFAGLLSAMIGRRPTRAWVIGTILAVSGGAMMVLARSGGASGRLDGAGVAAALAAGFGYALYYVTTEVLSERGVDSTEALAWQFSLGSLVLVPLLFTEPMGWLATAPGIIMALHLGFFTIGVAYRLVGYGLGRIDAPTATTLFQVEPVTAGLLAVVVLGERLPPIAWVGAGVVIVGVVIASRPSSQGAPTQAPA